MMWHNVRVLMVHELRMLLRDRRTVFLSIVLPILIMPVMLLGSIYVNQRREKSLEQTLFRYAVTGSEAQAARALVARGREMLASAPASASGERDSLSGFKFEELPVEDPEPALKAGKVDFYLRALSGGEADALRKKEPAAGDDSRSEVASAGRSQIARATRLPGVPVVQIFFQADREESRTGRMRMQELLTRVRKGDRERLLAARGLLVPPDRIMEVDGEDLASAGQVTGSYIGRFLTMFILMFMLGGGSVVAMDIIAGEKERGSLETLLTTSLSRVEIVTAKQLAILAVVLAITLIQVGNLLVYVTLRLVDLPPDWVIEAPPIAILTLLLLYIPFAAFVASVLLMISAYAKSYREAQMYFFPAYLVSLVPGLAAVLPGISLRSAIVLVPIANVSVAARDIMVGRFDWPMIAVTFAAMTGAAAWALRASARMLTEERLITSSEVDAADISGGPALFPRHVLRWYAVMLAAMFAIALNVPALAEMRRQVLFNELVIFLGAAVLMIRTYRLDLREAMALRPVRAPIWLAVLLLIPSGSIVTTGVFRVVNLVLPVPEQMLEQFGRELLPKDLSLAGLFFYLAILPGICEELAFRGTLLYGLRRKFRPIALALAVGIIFGFFHVALFRIIPTAFLGVILTALALLTGSVLPGMLLHIGNNALGVGLAKWEVPLARIDWRYYPIAVAVFLASFYVVYRHRTPYPGLRRD